MKIYPSNLLKKFTNKKDGNLAFHVGDNEKDVYQNHLALANKLRYELHSLVHMKQIHSNKLVLVNNEHNFNNPPTCDALITNKKNIPLMVMVADCTPVLFYAASTHTIAVAHAGRSGAFSNIMQNVIYSFLNDFHTNASDIVVSIGPSISQESYEVGEEIYEEAKLLGLEYAIKKKEEKYYLDICTILTTQLLSLGIKKEHIEYENICNASNTQEYFSYRKEGQTGRFAGLMMLR